MSHKKLLQSEDCLVTEVGKAYLRERVVMRGKDLHHDLGDLDWFAVHLYSITGRIFKEKELELLNYIWSSTSYPDPSIWPNNTAALAGSVRSTASLAMAAGLINSEATLFGGRPLKKTQDFFLRAKKAKNNGLSLEQIVEQEIKNNGVIFGYGRPLANVDERVPHTIKKVQELGFADGECVKMALEINDYLVETRKIAMNIVALDGAIGADFGFTPEEFHLYMNLCFYAGQPACYLDAVEKPEGSFFPVRCSSITFDGVRRRSWDC
jgi:citrate synthase